jgi:exocyst complex component 7
VIERFKAPLDSRDQEEKIIRGEPRRVGIPEYIASLERTDRALRGLRVSNLAANQNAMKELAALIKYGIRQLDELFKQTLQTFTPSQVEPLHFITKGTPVRIARPT